MVGNGTVCFMGTLQVEFGMPNQRANGSTWMRLTLDASTCHLNLFTYLWLLSEKSKTPFLFA